ncbi:unnamed protein product, partial [Amoebophrya sp. A120]
LKLFSSVHEEQNLHTERTFCFVCLLLDGEPRRSSVGIMGERGGRSAATWLDFSAPHLSTTQPGSSRGSAGKTFAYSKGRPCGKGLGRLCVEQDEWERYAAKHAPAARLERGIKTPTAEAYPPPPRPAPTPTARAGGKPPQPA